VLLSVTATGTAPLRYQWQLNGLNVSGGTNATLSLANIQISQAGTYDVVVYNSAGSTHATEFTLSAHVGLKILVQPASRFVKAGVTTNLIVSAEGSGGVSYFWSLNGGPITATNVTGVNSSVLTITNVQTFNQGIYTVMVTDDSGSIGSQPATLGIVSQPGFLVHPVSTSGLEGGTATFSVAMAGTPPIFFRWRHGSTNITNAVIYVNPTLGYSFLTLTNLQMSDAFANYNVVVTNLFGNATNASGAPVGVSSNAALTVLADADRDGIPDILEPLNGAADNDGDGMSNAAEYLAGTDYNNPNSALRLSIARSGLVTLSVTAVSNRTYTVQYTDSLSPRQWQKLADIVSRGFTRTEAVVDPSPGPNRIYRVVTPYQP
jgi:hypothetical protein